MTETPITMPDPEGFERDLRQHVAQSTVCHPDWHELDHAGYLIAEVGFDGEYVQAHMEDIIQQMIMTRAQRADAQSGRLG